MVAASDSELHTGCRSTCPTVEITMHKHAVNTEDYFVSDAWSELHGMALLIVWSLLFLA